MARNKLFALKQTKSVSDYIGEFNSLVYQIDDLSDSEAFYQFKKGLKPNILLKMDKLHVHFAEDANSL